MSIAPLDAAPAIATGRADAAIGVGRPAQPLASSETGHADFGAMLGQMMSEAAGVLKTAEAASLAGIKGQVPVQQVVDAVMSAEQTLQSAIAVRDKVVSAYLEISHMQI